MIRFFRNRPKLLVLMTVAALATALAIPATSFADNSSGCDFAATGTTESCSGPLSGSTFAGGDGNLLTNPTTFGATDWQNVAGLNKGIDLTSGNTDNSFGQGTKEDNANVSVVTGSIPPNKSDLTRFYEASELANGSNFLYLAWERTNVLGSANMDFEINQATQPDLTTAGPKTLNRTAGDLLVTFDFNNGGGRPTLGLLRWVTTGSSNQCFSSNSLPCWGNHVTLNGTNSIGAVNNLDSVTDPIAPNAPRSLAALTFGETAINLTAAGVFPPGTCEAFGSAFLKSRASSSFPAEVKDFVAPIPVNISNCGEMKIVKTGKDKNCTGEGTPPIGNGVCTGASSANLSGAKFSVTGPNNYSNNVTTGGDGTVCLTALAAGSYTVTETSPPTGYKADSTSGQTVSVTPSSSCTGSSPNSVTFSDSPLTNIVAKATSQVSGATNSTITCVDSGSNNVGNSPQGPKDPAEVDANDLTPGTYTCTIVIDP